ncbi:uncharacterized protein TNCV_3944471 [Trichonephila clavipes]|nr:uncharacterized protein TNCV_3944471 [Trichonephila clavipes]
MLVGLLSRWCFLIGGHGRRQWAGRTGDFGGLRKNQVQIRASRREARLLLVVRSRLGGWVVKVKEAKTRHRVSLVLAHVTTLEEDLKQQPLCQDSPKDVLSDSGLEIELAIPFIPNRDPPDTPQQSELGEVVHYHPSE